MTLALRSTVLVDGRGPLLIVLPSLGTTVDVWRSVVAELGGDFRVVGVDVPGHGAALATPTFFTVEDLAAAVVHLGEQDCEGTQWHVAGLSLGGCVALAASLANPANLASAAMVCSGAKVGDPVAWRERAALVRERGTSAVVDGSRERWFAPGFADARPDVSIPLLAELERVDAEGYARCCEALAAFDVRDRCHEVSVPLQVIAGTDDVATPPQVGALVADGVRDGQLHVIDGVGHLAPVEDPARVASLLGAHIRAAAGTGAQSWR